MTEFHRDLLNLPQLEQINLPDKRLYKTPEGNLYPSVTTILGKLLDKKALERWKERVGEEEAFKQANMASKRGNSVHELCEKYVLGQEIDFKSVMPINLLLFKQIKRVLDKHVNHIRLSEGRLYSNKLKVAGSVDLVAFFNGEPSIIDFKTSNNLKEKGWIESYFLQVSLYSFMLFEMTGLFYNNLVIIIGNEDANEAQVFFEKASNWIQQASILCKNYHLQA